MSHLGRLEIVFLSNVPKEIRSTEMAEIPSEPRAEQATEQGVGMGKAAASSPGWRGGLGVAQSPNPSWLGTVFSVLVHPAAHGMWEEPG